MLTVETETAAKYTFVMFAFIAVEAAMRSFLRAIDPAACLGGTAAWESIYNHLLGPARLTIPEPQRGSAIELLDLVREVRNLIHNNGVYFNRDAADRQLTYRGQVYSFRHGQPVDFVSWALLIEMVEGLRQLLALLTNHATISAIPAIIDPLADAGP